jgi:4-diphosphocytidyl-2-C-methyl-D-erythritol kinase
MVRIAACAKINLTLDVFDTRPDGYHGIASVMQTVSLHDTLEIEARAEPGIEFRCDAPATIPVPLDSTNLAVRAAQRILDGRPDAGVSIRLTKRIPAQAGLGGGSSDAAAALIGIDLALGLGLERSALLELAATLGSDGPFFLTSGTAVARGRGEIVSPLDDAPSFWLVIVKPDANVPTAEAYAALDAVPNRRSSCATEPMLEALKAADWERIVALQCNDFEPAVLPERPSILQAIEELRAAGALTARLCGSGAAVYGVAEDRPAAHAIASRMEGRYPHVHVATTVGRADCRDAATSSA